MIGMACAVITNMLTTIHSKKGTQIKTMVPEDFIPKWGVFENEITQEVPVQSVDEMKQFLFAMAKVQNAKNSSGERRRNK